jgi:hypothetical protein
MHARSLTRLTALTLLASTSFTSAAAADLPLAANARSDYTILTPAHPTPAESLAASELARYIQGLSSTHIETRAQDDLPAHAISVKIDPPAQQHANSPADPTRNEDAYTIRATPEGQILLRASHPRGLLHATYALLSRLGCRFLAPEFDHYNNTAEFVPRKETLTLFSDLNVESRPTLAYRKLYVEEGLSHDEPTLRRLIEWMPKVGYNVLVIPTDYQNHGRVKWDDWRAALTPELQRRGLIVEVGGHGYPNFLNAQMPDPNTPGKILFDTHPDWFATDAAGKRHPEPNWVFNTANPDAVRFMTDRLAAYVRERPEIQIFDLWPPDGERWDESPAGLAQGTPTDRMVQLTNEIRSQLSRIRPDLRLECIAYARYTTPPTNQKLDPSILVDFCPINQSFETSLADPTNPRNAAYAKDLAAWRNAFTGDLSLYGYYRKYAWLSLPVQLPHYLRTELRYFRKVPLQGVSTYSEPADWFTYELNHYTLAKLAWNPDADVDALITDFTTARYGDAADVARQALLALEEIVRNASTIPFTAPKPPAQLAAVRQRLERCDATLQSALTTTTPPTTRRNLEKLRLMLGYVLRDLHLQDMRAAKTPPATLRPEIESLRTFLRAHPNDGLFISTGTRPTLASLLKRYGGRPD